MVQIYTGQIDRGPTLVPKGSSVLPSGKPYQCVISFVMDSTMSPTIGLDHLLALDGNIEVQNDAGYWVKMEVSRVRATAQQPHGIRYSLTLHAPDNTLPIGFDNAHGVRPLG